MSVLGKEESTYVTVCMCVCVDLEVERNALCVWLMIWSVTSQFLRELWL